jgi:phosphatidylinositol alpha-mannosyltransferase
LGADERQHRATGAAAPAGTQPEAGLLFANRDVPGLTAALDRVLSDPELRDRLSAIGAELVRPYDWSVVAGEILRVYEIAIAATAPA